MKVLVSPAHINLSISLGSEESWACNFLKHLAMMPNIEVDAVCGRLESYPLPDRLRIFSVGVSKVDFLSQAIFRYRYYRLAMKLCEDADLVHHMFPFGFKVGFNQLAVSKKLVRKPFIIGPIQLPQRFSDINDYSLNTRSGGGFRTRMFYELEKVGLNAISGPLRVLQKATLDEAEVLVFESYKALELYQSVYPEIKSKFSKVILRAIETDLFYYRPPSALKNRLKILTVGYLLKRKGIQFLIKAMPDVIRVNKNVSLEIVGDGPYRTELERMVKDMSLEDYVRFRGNIPRSELPRVYADCDVYVQPSLSEGFLPTATREAMAVGRPVVATDVGSTEEIIKNGVNGYIVKAGDYELLSRAIVALLDDEGLRLKIGVASRESVDKLLGWNNVALQWSRVYEEAISRIN